MNHDEPLVTIITPVFNGRQYLRECIESVLGQTYRNWEYVIADNCSTDDTRAIAESYAAKDSRIKVIPYEQFLPMLANHNRAFGAVPEHSVYTKPLMADDWLYPECVESMVDAAERHPSIGLVCCYSFDGTYGSYHGFPWPAGLVPGKEAARTAILGLGDTLTFGSPTTMLMRSQHVRARNPHFYNETNLKADAEAALSILLDQGVDFAFIHRVLCMMRLHKNSTTETIAWKFSTVIANDNFLLHKFGPRCLDNSEFEKKSATLMRAYYEELARQFFRLRKRDFWDLHRENFRQMAVPFSYPRFAAKIFRELAVRLASPQEIARALTKRVVR